MSEYDIRPGGALKLRGGVIEGGIVKKRGKKSKKKPKHNNQPAELEGEQQQTEKVVSGKEVSEAASGSGRNSPAVIGGNGSGGPRKTEAEKRFEESQRKRLADRVAKAAGKTHKDRVNEFNAKLEALSEHHDIPKVGPG